MTMSDHERRLLAELARRLEEQDPALAAALQGRPPPAADRAAWPGPTAARWHSRVRTWQHAPLRTALVGGALTFAVLLTSGHLAHQPAPDPGAKDVAEIFTEQIPQP